MESRNAGSGILSGHLPAKRELRSLCGGDRLDTWYGSQLVATGRIGRGFLE